MAVVPDPFDHEARAIDTDTGELLGGIYWCKTATPAAPTLAELQASAIHIGWGKPTTEADTDHAR